MSRKLKTFIFTILFTMSFLSLAYVVWVYAILGISPLLDAKTRIANFSISTWKTILSIHISIATIALALGPIQLLKKVQANRKLHRILGKVYAYSIFINTPIAVYLALYATGGIGGTFGFLLLDLAWVFTTATGVRYIIKKNVQEHRRWMLRSYAVTWVFVSFRLIVPILTGPLHLPESIGFPLAVVTSLVLNLYLVERYIRKGNSKITASDITLGA